jgi:hypothetical protein
VIICNRCGKLVRSDLVNCQNCGVPLPSTNRGGTDLRKSAHEQPELPAWLESLRANERPASTASEQAFFSSADLIDEGALPSWMRPESAEMMEKSNTGKYPVWRPASITGPNTDDGMIPPRGFAASSLIDEQSLPSWVQGNQEPGQSPTGSSFPTPDAQRNFSAASLIQPDDLPEWMKSSSQLPQGAAPVSNAWGELQSPAYQAGVEPITPSQGITGNELIDPQALPYRMSDQPGQQVSFFPGAASTGGQQSLSASSLLDVNSLPSWLREGEQAQGRAHQMPVNYQSSPTGQPGQIDIGSSGLTGASLIDMNAIPDWLRSSEAQQQGGISPAGNARPAPYGTPRIESARVPSRPRGEMAPQGQSEVAANVFSSMLGVASSTPYYPSTGSQASVPSSMPPSQQGFQGNVGVTGYATPDNNAGLTYQGSMPIGQSGAQQAPGYTPGAYSGGYQPGMSQPLPGYDASMSMHNQRSNTSSPASKPTRRGIIETIRSWFS